MNDLPSPGDSVLHYRVLRPIGSGGMGVVYEAEDTRLGRKVALKFIPTALVAPDAIQRFQREARAASALNHPGICTVYAIEEWDGRHFIAMELLDGQSLDVRIGGRALPWETIADIGIQVADAMDAAHGRGIVHRDIKPANIFLGRDGRAKVLDFGVATSPTGGEDGETIAAGTAADKLTRPGTAVGTIAYMSPEQARGETLDARSDLFSLGAVLYEMATARAAFAGKTTAVIFQQILGEDPQPPRELNGALPRKLEEIILKALEKDRDLRYQTAAELRGDLKRLKRDTRTGAIDLPAETVAATRPPQSSGAVLLFEARRHKAVTGGVAALLLVLLASAAYGLYALVDDRTPAETTPPGSRISMTRLTSNGQAQGCGSITPDGKYVSYCTFAGELRVVQVATGQTLVLGNYRGAATFSPDGNYLYMSSESPAYPTGVLWRIPTIGGEARRIVTNILGAPALSPDGQRIAFLRVSLPDYTTELIVADADGSNERRLLIGTKEQWVDYPGLAWSPDGRWLAGNQGSSAGGRRARPVVIDVESGAIEPVGTRSWPQFGRTTWLPGNVILFSAPERADGPHQFWTIKYPGGEAVRITGESRGFGNISVSATADGSTIATIPVELVSNLWETNADASEAAVQWTSGTRQDGEDDIRPLSEGRVFFRSFDGGDVGVWSIDRAGAPPRKLTPLPTGSPAIPADGRFVAFAGLKEDRESIWRMEPDGSGLRPISKGPDDINALVSPDGRWIYYWATPGLKRISADGGAARHLHDLAFPQDISPDGRHLLVQVPDSTGLHLEILDAETGALIKRLQAQTDATWTARWGRRADLIAFLVAKGDVVNLWEQPIDGGTARPLTTFTEQEIFGFGYSPDRRRLFLGRGKRTGDVYLIRDFQ